MRAGGFISATIRNVKPAGRYRVIVRLAGSTPLTLTAYPPDGATLDGQLLDSPVAFTFETVKCDRSDLVPSTDGSACVCAPGYISAEPAAAGAAGPDDDVTCEPCPQGSYREDIDAASCQACDVSTSSTLRAGSASASDCVCKAGCVLCAIATGQCAALRAGRIGDALTSQPFVDGWP